ncbi:conserved exported hypothetical protein [Verrucomicrobia bacterium]|nr:conserved exported hypothetical protein [Verrucomicrobiota bacterium]
MNTQINKWTVALASAGLINLASVALADDAAAPTNAPNAAAAAPNTNAPPTTAAGTPIGTKANEGFWKRLDDALREQLGTPAFTPAPPGSPPPDRRGNLAPFDSPPYPNGEWQIGGTEIIGDKNLTSDYWLMQALYQGPHGQAWANSGIKLYGWEDVSANWSTSYKSGINPVTAQAANFPAIYDQRPNRVEQNQFVLYAERTPDENQRDHIDWGFRLSAVYGLDYRYMISRGFFSDQLTKHNNFYGYDSPMMYGNLYIPWIAQGMNITIGRIISEADIEAQLAPNNLMSSHSLLYGYDPYCQWGVFTTTKLNRNWTVQAGIADGNDVALWETRDPGYQPTGTVMVQYQTSDNKFGFYGGANAFNNAQWGFNNLQQYVGTFTYKFSEKIWTSHETWYMYQKNAATGPTPSVPYSDGQFPVKPGYAPEWATLNYTMFRLAPSTFLTVRNEVFDDIVGQRTGYATIYSEHSIGITYWPSKLITFRPELRFDHAYDHKSYDLGTRKNQFMAQFDVVFHF